MRYSVLPVGKRSDYPPFPDNYFKPREQAILNEYRLRLAAAQAAGEPAPGFPEQLVAAHIDNTWHDTAEGILGNWIGLVYQLTHEQRKLPFMDEVNPHNPLGLDWIAGSASITGPLMTTRSKTHAIRTKRNRHPVPAHPAGRAGGHGAQRVFQQYREPG